MLQLRCVGKALKLVMTTMLHYKQPRGKDERTLATATAQVVGLRSRPAHADTAIRGIPVGF
jgi:hypothetical protein